MKGLTVIALLLLSISVVAAAWQPIDGIYAVTAQGYLDPAVSDAQDSHYRLQLRGRSARDLYRAMQVMPVVDECTGGQAKNIGQMQCLYYQTDDNYECHFSIDISNQQIDYGVAC